MEWINDWEKINESSKAKTKIDISKIFSRNSISPIETLQRHLRINFYYGIAFIVCYISIGLFFPHWSIITFVAVAASFTLYTVVTGYSLFKKLINWQKELGLVQELKKINEALEKWLKLTERIALLVYPFAISGGFILGGTLSANMSFMDLFDSNIKIYALILCVVILTPVSYYLTKYLNQKAFGAYINRIKQLIKDVEAE